MGRLGKPLNQDNKYEADFSILRKALICVLDELTVVRGRGRPIAQRLGRLGGAVQPIETVRAAVELGFERGERLSRFADRQEHVAQQLACRQDLARRDRLFVRGALCR